MSGGGDDDGFLSRWSRRKRAVAAEQPEAPLPEAAEPDPDPAETRPEPETPEDEAAILAELGLPDPDTLGKGDDFTVYMARAVPEAIRRRALRRLWRSNPTLAVLDGLNDYDGDYTGGFVKPGTIQTLYKVGRGFVQEVAGEQDEEVTAEAAETPRAASSVRPPAQRDEGPDEDAGAASADSPTGVETAEDTDAGGETEGAENGGDSEVPARATGRRMAFRFDDPG